MKTLAIFNDDVAYDLGLSFEALYIAGYLHSIRNTTLVETKVIGGEEWFTFSLVDLFKKRKLVFDQLKENDLNEADREAEIKKLYNKNKSRFERLLKKDLHKLLIRGNNEKVEGGSKTYYKLNKSVLTVLINGYAKVVDTDLTENEKILIDSTGQIEISRGIRTQLKKMDTESLKEAVNISLAKNTIDFPFIKGVYNNILKNKKADTGKVSTESIENNFDNNSIHEKDKKYTRENKENYKKTKFHNCEQTFEKYSVEEFGEIIDKSQEAKYKNKEASKGIDINIESLITMAIEELQENTIIEVKYDDSYWKPIIDKKVEELKYRK